MVAVLGFQMGNIAEIITRLVDAQSRHMLLAQPVSKIFHALISACVLLPKECLKQGLVLEK